MMRCPFVWADDGCVEVSVAAKNSCSLVSANKLFELSASMVAEWAVTPAGRAGKGQSKRPLVAFTLHSDEFLPDAEERLAIGDEEEAALGMTTFMLKAKTASDDVVCHPSMPDFGFLKAAGKTVRVVTASFSAGPPIAHDDATDDNFLYFMSRKIQPSDAGRWFLVVVKHHFPALYPAAGVKNFDPWRIMHVPVKPRASAKRDGGISPDALIPYKVSEMKIIDNERLFAPGLEHLHLRLDPQGSLFQYLKKQKPSKQVWLWVTEEFNKTTNGHLNGILDQDELNLMLAEAKKKAEERRAADSKNK